MKRLTGATEGISRILCQGQLELSKESPDVDDAVRQILEGVRENGDRVLKAYSEKFDKITLDSFEVGRELVDRTSEEIGAEVLEALKNTKANVEGHHKQQLEEGFEDQPTEGIVRGRLTCPIECVGVCAPGGTAAYPSSALMNVIPTKIAGAKEIIMTIPPQTHFEPATLVATSLAGVDKIYQVGGAQGVTASTYSTETIPCVDKITGPGNISIVTAKGLVYGTVGTDMIAGPSEIGAIADDTTNPRYVAADLLSQAEHDVRARVILATNLAALMDAIEKGIKEQLKTLPREEIARVSAENNGRIIIADSAGAIFELMDQMTSEHLEIVVDSVYDYLDAIESAGSVSLGHPTSEPIGDRYAGANRTLSTTGTGRFSPMLGVHNFVKRIQYMQYSRVTVSAASCDITAPVYAEGLQAHAKAIEVHHG